MEEKERADGVDFVQFTDEFGCGLEDGDPGRAEAGVGDYHVDGGDVVGCLEGGYCVLCVGGGLTVDFEDDERCSLCCGEFGEGS